MRVYVWDTQLKICIWYEYVCVVRCVFDLVLITCNGLKTDLRLTLDRTCRDTTPIESWYT